MRYFLDFDRTIYDTDAFKKSLKSRPTVYELLLQLREAIIELFTHNAVNSRRRRFLQTSGTFLSHGRFTFAAEDLKKFLYPDVMPFLASHDCTIVTYGVRAFITAKVTTALTGQSVTDIVYTSRKKGRTIARLSALVEDECTFVDDKIFQLASVARWCPTVRVIEIRRDGKAGDGRWPVIHELSEI